MSKKPRLAHTTEEQIRFAARLYDARRAVQSLCGDGYQRLVQKWMELLRMAMAREHKSALSAVLVLAKHTRNEFDTLWLFAAAVEVIEADERRAALPAAEEGEP